MRPDTKRHIHFGVNLIMTPGVPAPPDAVIELQRRLAEPARGITFDSVRREGPQVLLQRLDPALELRVGPVNWQEFQVLVMSRSPMYRLEDYADDLEAVAECVRDIWPQLLCTWRRQVTIAHLYAVGQGSALQYLWTQRLGQPERDLERLGRQVRGGGLRLVLPPAADIPGSPSTEIRIETYFADLSQLFVEGHCEWRDPAPPPGGELRDLLADVEAYLDAEVRSFVGLVAA
jgi:hypothetical protein